MMEALYAGYASAGQGRKIELPFRPAGSEETHRSVADCMSDDPRMMRDIRDQPESLKQVLDHQFGRGAHALEQAADTIRSVPTIIVTGMGASLYGAMPLAYQLNSIGRACQVVEAGELLHFGGDLPRGALVIIVSRSGETVEAVNLLPKPRPPARM